jgi:hypothetical protein
MSECAAISPTRGCPSAFLIPPLLQILRIGLAPAERKSHHGPAGRFEPRSRVVSKILDPVIYGTPIPVQASFASLLRLCKSKRKILPESRCCMLEMCAGVSAEATWCRAGGSATMRVWRRGMCPGQEQNGPCAGGAMQSPRKPPQPPRQIAPSEHPVRWRSHRTPKDTGPEGLQAQSDPAARLAPRLPVA